MKPIIVQHTEQYIQITLDKNIFEADFLMDLTERLRIEYLSKKIDFSEEILELAKEIKKNYSFKRDSVLFAKFISLLSCLNIKNNEIYSGSRSRSL